MCCCMLGGLSEIDGCVDSNTKVLCWLISRAKSAIPKTKDRSPSEVSAARVIFWAVILHMKENVLTLAYEVRKEQLIPPCSNAHIPNILQGMKLECSFSCCTAGTGAGWWIRLQT